MRRPKAGVREINTKILAATRGTRLLARVRMENWTKGERYVTRGLRKTRGISSLMRLKGDGLRL